MAFAVLLTAGVLLGAPPAGAAVDWTKVPSKNIMLFYPAQVSWERLFTPGRHSGQRKFHDGKNCFGCHGAIDEDPLGDSLVHAERDLEPTPIAKKPGSVKVAVKVAHDAANVYVRLEFDPGEQPNAEMDKDYETKVAMMIDDGGVTDMARAGCWVACHDGVASMAHAVPDTTKYILATRTTSSDGVDQIKPQADIDQMRADGHFIEYWQAKLKAGAPAKAVDGTILEKRTENPKPMVNVQATQAKGIWTVTFSRKMIGEPGHKDIVPGKTYNVGFAIHAGYTLQRFHYVSFERTLVLDDGTADFVAKK